MARRKLEDVDKSLDKLLEALKSPKTMDELVKKFDVHRTTIWQWMNALEDEGIKVVRANRGRPEKYQLLT